jgi:hypothetical protein
MKITLSKRNAAFAMSPIREGDKLSDVAIVRQLKEQLADYQPDAPIQIEIPATRFFQLYQAMSSLREIHSAEIADSIMAGSETVPPLAAQIQAAVLAGDEEAIWLAEQITQWQTTFYRLREEDIQNNLNWLNQIEL